MAKFIVIGERIHCISPTIRQAMETMTPGPILDRAREQLAAGATYPANYGGRTPTIDEWEELINNTTVTWTTQNGVNGRLFTGTNGNSLFLPAAGFRWESSLNDAGSYGYYWSSSLNAGSPYNAWNYYFSSSYQCMSYQNRSYGYTVRAVRSAQ